MALWRREAFWRGGMKEKNNDNERQSGEVLNNEQQRTRVAAFVFVQCEATRERSLAESARMRTLA